MAQSGFTPIKLYLSTTAAAVPTAGNLEPGELAINNNDGKLFYEDSSGVVQVIATKAGASGDVVGPASSTANAVPSFNGTTGKLIQDNSGVTIAAGVLTATGVSAAQVDITAQGDLRLQDTTGGEYVALQAPATIASSYTLTLPVDDGTAGQALITDGSGVLSWSTAASGDVYGPASATDNAVARFDLTTGKLIQNSVVTIADDGATVIAANSASDGLRITQVGAGNALVVEDSANPDATPFAVSADGAVFIGTTPTSTFASQATHPLQVFNAATLGLRFTDTASSTFVTKLARSRGSITVPSSVISGDGLGNVSFQGYDGIALLEAAGISAAVDGTPGTNDMPGRLVFSTTADGASSPTERMRIDNAGRVGIGGTPTASYSVFNAKAMTGATTEIGYGLVSTIQSDVTTLASGYRSNLTTQATAFTLTNLYHYEAAQTAFGAGSTVTNQYGFVVGTTLTGATNNYGFYSNIASGTGRYNFYAAGTASNYFGGNTIVEVTDNTNAALRITQLGTGNALLVEDSANPDATPTVITASGQVVIGSTTALTYGGFSGSLQINTTGQTTFQLAGWQTTSSAAPQFVFARSASGTVGTNGAVVSGSDLGAIRFLGDDGTAFITAAEILAEVDGTPGTNDMPGRLVFSTTADGASSPTERMRIRSDGNIGLGGVGNVAVNFYNQKNITGATTAFGNYIVSTIQSDVTTIAYGNRTALATAAASFTLGTLVHFDATQGTFGAGSTVTNQYGFSAPNTLIGATNNYGFYGAITSGTGRYNFYAAGSAANVFVGTTSLGGAVGSESLRVTPVASAVNYAEIQGAVTTGAPVYLASGSDTNINLYYSAKGTGAHYFQTSSTNQFVIAHTASAVNYVQVSGATAADPTVSIRANGSSANVGMDFFTKGSGKLAFRTDRDGTAPTQFVVAHTASAVNYLQVTGGAAGVGVSLSAQGSDANIINYYSTKGTGSHAFYTGGGSQFTIGNIASSVNAVVVYGSATGTAVQVAALGSDTNIDLALTPKGTGVLAFGTYTAGVVAQAGYITIKDAGGTTRRLLVG